MLLIQPPVGEGEAKTGVVLGLDIRMHLVVELGQGRNRFLDRAELNQGHGAVFAAFVDLLDGEAIFKEVGFEHLAVEFFGQIGDVENRSGRTKILH